MDLKYKLIDKNDFFNHELIHCDTNNSELPPFKCTGETCTNTYLKRNKSSAYKFHNFPRDKTVLTKWLNFCNLPANTPITNITKICSDHFRKEDYEFNSTTNKLVLKSTAVPAHASQETNGENTVILCDSNEETEINPILEEAYLLNTQKQELFNEYNNLYRKLNKLDKLKSNRKKLIKHYKKLLRNTPKKRCTSSEKNHLMKVFSESQLNVLMGEKNVVWSEDDLARAFTMRHMGSKECYLYLKDTLKMPLPSLSCIQKWISSCNVPSNNAV